MQLLSMDHTLKAQTEQEFVISIVNDILKLTFETGMNITP